jgi:hypothetical protein
MNLLPKQNSKSLPSRKNVIAYLKNHCIGFNESKVFIAEKHNKQFQLVVFVDGKMHVETFYNGVWALDLLIPRIEGYLQNGQWDNDLYYQPYTPKPGDVNTMYCFGPVLRSPLHLNFYRLIEKFRDQYPTVDLGFRDVPPTPSAIYFT